MAPVRQLKIVIWNANGLDQRSLERKTFLITNSVDIMLISETHFTSKNCLKIPKYTIHHTHHPSGRARGGSALIIKSSIRHHELENSNDDCIQTTSVSVEDSKGSINFSAIYCPPGHVIKQEKFIGFFKKLGSRFIAGGDYNAKHPFWGSRSATPSPRGKQLYEALQKNKLTPISTGEPTYWPSNIAKTPDLINFFVAKGISPHSYEICSDLELTSDHSPVILTLSLLPKTNKVTQNSICWKINWDIYRAYINENLNCKVPLKSNDDLENEIENGASKTRPERVGERLPAEILSKIKGKSKLRKIWQDSRLQENKVKINKSIKEIKNILRNYKQEKTKTYLQSLAPTESTNCSLWKATKYLNRPTRHIPPIKVNNKWARSDRDKAKIFAEHLYEVFGTPDRQITEMEENLLLQESPPPRQGAHIMGANVREVRDLIRKLKARK
ncbi:hypothetical protein TKK_0009848 [Trichogramma kaykai]